MYVPKNLHWFFPTATVLLGFFVRKNIADGWDVIIFVQAPLVFVAITHALYIWQAGVMYQGYVTRSNENNQLVQDIRDAAAKERGKTPEGFRPIEDLNKQVSYANTVTAVRFDKERQMANILIHQRDHNFDITLKEDYWIKSKPRRFDGSRDEFVKLIGKWEGWGILRRIDPNRKNSTYEVGDWRQVELIANGNPLPSLDYVQ